MRLTLLTLGMVGAPLLDPLWLAGLLPALVLLVALAIYLKPAARRRPLRKDNSAWRGVHRKPRRELPPGRHTPARGKRLEGLSRQAQLEEPTARLTAADVARIFDVPPALLEPTGPLDDETRAVPVAAHEHKPYRDGVRIRCRACKLDLEAPEDMPEVGRNGFSSWA